MDDKILICTNTFFQLIVAIQLKLTRFLAADVDVIITAHSENSKAVADRLKNTNLFRNVFYAKYRDDKTETSEWEKYEMYGRGRICSGKILSQYVQLKKDYNIFLFNNANFLTFLIWQVYKPQIHCYQFEEGFSTYTKPFLNKKLFHRLLLTVIYGSLEKHVKGLYLFHPELFHRSVNYPLIRIEPLSKKDEILKKTLNYIFNYSSFRNEYTEKYIFMGESFQTAGIEMDDVELAKEIAEAVGSDKLIVKTHPRSAGGFLQNNLKICGASQIPWEVILLNEDFSDKVLLTITSGSVLAAELYFKERIKTYLLFNCVSHHPPMLDDSYLGYISEIAAGEDVFIIPRSKPELIQELKQEVIV